MDDINNVEELDFTIVKISWFGTCVFVVLSLVIYVNNISRFTINYLLVSIIALDFTILIWTIESRYLQFLHLLHFRIFDGTSLLFCAFVNAGYLGSSTSVHRKFFHLTISLVALTGLIYDPKLVTLAAHLMLQIFIIIELFRALRVRPWFEYLDRCLLSFLDNQDSPRLILTPILLFLGIFLTPLLVYPWWMNLKLFNTPTATLYFSGIQTVGIGDSFAALIGQKFGKTKWPTGNGKKTIEGSVAMLFSQVLLMPLLLDNYLSLSLFLSAIFTTIIEAHLEKWDNIILSIVSFGCYFIFG